jgi:hypothetical protein
MDMSKIERSQYRGFLTSSYRTNIKRQSNISAKDNREVARDFLKVATQVWLREAIIQIQTPFENWVQETELKSQPEIIDLLTQAIDRFINFSDKVNAFWEKLEFESSLTFTNVEPMVQNWLNDLNFVIINIGTLKNIMYLKDNISENNKLLCGFFLYRIEELRDDMEEVFPFIKELLE